jgi:transcriptional antiterminator Rof (Rho-off)
MEEYRPVDCSLHDQLEAFATTGQPCRIAYEDDDGRRREAHDRIADVYAEGGVEYVRTGAGNAIRLDRIRQVDGVHADAVDDPHPDELHGHP